MKKIQKILFCIFIQCNCTYCRLIRDTSNRLRRECPCELWWLSGVELAIRLSSGRKNDLLLLLLGESSEHISESLRRDSDISSIDELIIVVGIVGVEVITLFFVMCSLLPLFNAKIDKNDVNKPKKNNFNKRHLFIMIRMYFFCKTDRI